MSKQTVILSLLLSVTLSAHAQSSPDKVPTGIWRNATEGFVVRIESCGTNLCGYIVGYPEGKKLKPQDVCGKTIMKDFRPKGNDHWSGVLHPPELDKDLGSQMEFDGVRITLHARFLLISKTLTFERFGGQIREDCHLTS